MTSNRAGDSELAVYVQPRASRTEIVGMHGDAVKIRLAAPPVEGAANVELIRFLAKALTVPRSAVVITAGAGSRHKRVRVNGMVPETIRAALLKETGEGVGKTVDS